MSQVAVKIENLSVYYEQTPAITGVCFDVEEGEYLGIIGPNGGGKTTLLKSILGLIPINSGSIEIYGKKIGKNRKVIGYVPQIATMDKRFPISVIEVVLTGRLNQGLSPFYRFSKQDKEIAFYALENVGLKHLAHRQISELSGGEFQRMLIARALTVNPKILLLDEPTASVDAVSRNQIYSLLGELNKKMTIILVTHDLLAVSSQVTKLACLNEKLVYHGEPELTEKIVTSLYGCPVDLIAHGVPHRVLKCHEEVNSFD
ncbi:metal ABC transporter ATP-binding protein [Anaerovorax odorimutans]|uniref:metal ABC transporter ATP-binding protein n=1 Tax=Anaerovorax odorimutans TaxID=109327 RepID=UPI000415A80A|nr:ABC transporter ATP-binding protein [Anaerovorax odorimutans]